MLTYVQNESSRERILNHNDPLNEGSIVMLTGLRSEAISKTSLQSEGSIASLTLRATGMFTETLITYSTELLGSGVLRIMTLQSKRSTAKINLQGSLSRRLTESLTTTTNCSTHYNNPQSERSTIMLTTLGSSIFCIKNLQVEEYCQART